MASLQERLLRHSKLVGECREWTGYIAPFGYGKIRVNNKSEFAHRAAWFAVNGDIPAGMKILHKCDNRRCINVDHLFIGTQADNMTDMARKKRRRGVGGQRGAVHHNAKLDECKVSAIRASNKPDAIIAAEYGLTKRYVNAIRHRVTWKHI